MCPQAQSSRWCCSVFGVENFWPFTTLPTRNENNEAHLAQYGCRHWPLLQIVYWLLLLQSGEGHACLCAADTDSSPPFFTPVCGLSGTPTHFQRGVHTSFHYGGQINQMGRGVPLSSTAAGVLEVLTSNRGIQFMLAVWSSLDAKLGI
jgi:hypothetical protein